MLSSVLNSRRAIEVNIQIVRVFTKIREVLMNHQEMRLEIEGLKKDVKNNSKNIEVVFQYLDELMEKNEKTQTIKRIGFMPDEL